MPRPDWRDLPPVEPIERPSRLSVTFLRHANACPRSAYFYLRYGSLPSHELDRGTALHLMAEQVPWLLIQHAETHREGAPEQAVPTVPVLEADAAKDLIEQVLDDHPELGVTVEDAVHLREMAYHLAGDERGRRGELKPDGKPYPQGYAWRPDEVVAVERLFTLTVADWQIVGKVDLAHLGVDRVLDVEDFKTSLHVPLADEYEGSIQTKLYGVEILFGNPIGQHGEIEPNLGEFVEWVRCSEVFPRYLRPDGSVTRREVIYSRQELHEFMGDLERLVRRIDLSFDDWRWPAISSTRGCSICPARSQCPLPAHLRSHAGEINTVEQASEALEWADQQGDLVAATREEAKRFARARDVVIPVGVDEEYAFTVGFQTKTDWDAIQRGAERAAQYGEPFNVADHRVPQPRNNFKKRRREAVRS